MDVSSCFVRYLVRKHAYEFLVPMRHPALRLSVIRVQVERLRVRTVLARNLSEVLLSSRNLDNGIDLPCAFLRIGVLRAATREVEVVLRSSGRRSGQE